ncbi:MAG: alpha/beta hydrolase [Lachnospiraceae bacterium]|nr:alpha/beta hydrolase [Lachnospiraceae bacterium]
MTKVYKNDKAAKAIRESYDALLGQWNCEYKELELEGRYGVTHVIEFGSKEKEPLILFHGVGDDAALMWVYNAKELGEHFHVYAIDTIGGPGKSVPGGGYDKSFEDVTWIDEILDALSLEQVFMAGVSNGAYLTQAYSICRPERVRKGISMAGSVPIAAKGFSMLGMMKVFLPEALFPTDKNVKKLIQKMTGDHFHMFTENETLLRHFKELMTGFNRAAMMNHKVRGFSRSEVLSIKDKMLYIVGKKDPFMTMGGEALMGQYPMNVKWFDDAGHGINHEKAAEVNQLIIDYFS